MKLLEKYKELGHSVYMDNYIKIRQLKCSKLHCMGTLRKNRRNNPKDVTEAKLRRNEYICRWTDDGICYMGGIDNLDQMLAYYPCDRKTLKLYKKLAIHFFQIIMVNSFKLFDSYSGTKKKTLSEFRLEVIRELGARRDNKRDVECFKKKLIKKTITYCCDCVDEPGLCMEPCFLMYHGRDPNSNNLDLLEYLGISSSDGRNEEISSTAKASHTLHNGGHFSPQSPMQG
ncbi:hypothetical protein J437_LFUL004837 [Ladona fulva]|uniref:PiggyBac transposable element-derived protein domain-containing protein n=1 Tax=Ladona fulva TaxID=123851 RepID=A0A8K0K3G8_LADFU|nr:hypothetical protein J437_LFUL004837 [Ladona fulva]